MDSVSVHNHLEDSGRVEAHDGTEVDDVIEEGSNVEAGVVKRNRIASIGMGPGKSPGSARTIW